MDTMNTARERPILFSAPMVRAILAGTKTQTRRVRGLELPNANPRTWALDILGRASALFRCIRGYEPSGLVTARCPYGAPGDRLWVRETWGKWDTAVLVGRDPAIVYRADFAPDLADDVTWRPSIHMPRLACRIVVEITDVRVQRLHDISEDDARAEGVEINSYFPERWSTEDGWLNYDYPPDYDGEDYEWCANARDSFASLWRSINGVGAWDANPWVWALTFKRVTP